MAHAPLEEPRADEPHTLPTESLLIVRVAHDVRAIPLMLVDEVLTFRPATIIPGVDPAVSGMVNVGGRVIAVVNLAAALGAQNSEMGADHRLLIINHRGRQVGLGVNDVLRIARVAVAGDDAPEKAGAAPTIARTAQLETGEVDVLDVDIILESILS
jgi:chemotaxis signal transduction protein